jgi:hypothetical protein
MAVSDCVMAATSTAKPVKAGEAGAVAAAAHVAADTEVNERVLKAESGLKLGELSLGAHFEAGFLFARMIDHRANDERVSEKSREGAGGRQRTALRRAGRGGVRRKKRAGASMSGDGCELGGARR